MTLTHSFLDNMLGTAAWMQTAVATTMDFAKRSCTLGTFIAIWIPASFAAAVSYT
jgi:hypothetical protein